MTITVDEARLLAVRDAIVADACARYGWSPDEWVCQISTKIDADFYTIRGHVLFFVKGDGAGHNEYYCGKTYEKTALEAMIAFDEQHATEVTP